MKRYSFLNCLLLTVTLLTTQIGNAFVMNPVMLDCDMGMSSGADHNDHQSMMPMDSMMKGNKASLSSDMSGTMDCCDMPESVTCCESECQCTAFIASTVLLNNVVYSGSFKSSIKPTIRLILYPPSPYLHQPKRPPINDFS